MLSAETVSVLFAEYGDFFVARDTKDAWFIEVYHLEKIKLDQFIDKIRESSNVVRACMYKDAPQFKAH